MPIKIIVATEARVGTNIITEDGAACTVKSMDVSKTGKHGASKVRMEVVGIIDGKKRVILKPGHERFNVPLVEKKRGQVLSVIDNTVGVMDMDSFETLNLSVPEEFKDSIKEGVQLEYWDVEGQKIIKRII